MITTPQQARNAIGLMPDEICKKFKLEWATIRAFELHGCSNFKRAKQLATFYQCDTTLFLHGERGAKRK